MSHQISLSTNGAFTLDSFKVPDSVTLAPVKPGERRGSRIDPVSRQVCAFHFAEDDDVNERPLLPPGDDWWAQLPLLTMQLDQGGTGTAGAAH